MHIEYTFGIVVLLTSAACGLAVIFREYTHDVSLWSLSRTLGLLAFLCWLSFGAYAVQECEMAQDRATHWRNLAATKSSNIGVYASHREIQTPGGGRLEWERTSAGTTTRPMFRAAERIGRGDGGTGCCDAACAGAGRSVDSLRGSEQSRVDGIEGGQRL